MELYDWMLNFRNNEYAELNRIFRLPLDNSPNGPELWDRYFERNMNHLIEMGLLRRQARICREKWNEAPLFGGNKNGKEETTNKDDDRQVSQGVGV